MAALLVAAALAVTACSGGNDEQSAGAVDNGSAASNDSDATSDVAASEATATDSALPDGVYLDPEGRYTMEIPDDWRANHGALDEGIEVWMVSDPADGFAPNINVLSQPAAGFGLEEYIDLSVDNAPRFFEDFELIERTTVTGSDGQELALLEYSGAGLRYLNVVFIANDHAVVATLTVNPERFDEIYAEAERFLLTLQPT